MIRRLVNGEWREGKEVGRKKQQTWDNLLGGVSKYFSFSCLFGEYDPIWRIFFKVTFLGCLSDPFQGSSGLLLGDRKVTLNHLVWDNLFFEFFIRKIKTKSPVTTFPVRFFFFFLGGSGVCFFCNEKSSRNWCWVIFGGMKPVGKFPWSFKIDVPRSKNHYYFGPGPVRGEIQPSHRW